MEGLLPGIGPALWVSLPVTIGAASLARRIGSHRSEQSRFVRRHAWLGAAVGVAVGGGTLVAGFLLGDPTRGIPRLQGRSLGLLVGGVALGMTAAALGVGHLRAYRIVVGTDTTPVDAVTPGTVEVAGIAAADERVAETPFTGREALCCRYLVEDRRTDGSDWKEKTGGTVTESFWVEDETGRVRVDPGDAELALAGRPDRTATVTVDGPDDPPGRIGDWLWERQMSTGPRKRRYREWWLASGDEVYVMGTAVDHSENGPVIATDERSPRFLVTHGSPAEIATRHSRLALRWLIVGVSVAVPSYLLLVVRLWPG